MDIHSFISPLLIVISIIIIYVRNRKYDEEAIFEVEFTFIVGSIALVVCTILISLLYFIIFNEKLFSQYEPTPRQVIISVQYYYTLIYYITVALNSYVLKD